MDFDEDEHIINDSDFISLEILQMEFNCLSPDNDKYFSDDEKNMINNHIDKLINKQRKIDKNNIDKLKATDLGTMKIL